MKESLKTEIETLEPFVMAAAAEIIAGIQEKTGQLIELEKTKDETKKQLDGIQEEEPPKLSKGVSVSEFSKMVEEYQERNERFQARRAAVQKSFEIVSAAFKALVDQLKEDEKALAGTVVSAIRDHTNKARREFFRLLSSVFQKNDEYTFEVERVFKAVEAEANQGVETPGFGDIAILNRHCRTHDGILVQDTEWLRIVSLSIKKHTTGF